MIPLHEYVKIKDNYCLCYYGESDEYLVLLRLLKPIIENHLPKLKLHISCKDEKAYLLDNAVKLSEGSLGKFKFAHAKEIKYSGEGHPIEELIAEIGINAISVTEIAEVTNNNCVIVTKGNHPTKSLNSRQISAIKQKCIERNYETEIDVPPIMQA